MNGSEIEWFAARFIKDFQSFNAAVVGYKFWPNKLNFHFSFINPLIMK